MNDGTSESARFTLAVAPGWRMLDARQTIVGPSSTGSQSASVRLGSAAETTVAASIDSPSASVTPTTRPSRERISATSAPVRIVTPYAFALASSADASAPLPPLAIVLCPGAPPSLPAESIRNTAAEPAAHGPVDV